MIAGLLGLDQSKYSFVADVGDCWFIGLELRADVFLAPGYYASMGFGVPGALGAGRGRPSRRPFALVGDGAFQMTGTELATMVDQGLRPIVLLLNNGSYGMLEALDAPRPYYDRRPWDYLALRPGPGLRRRAGLDRRRVPRRPRPGRGRRRPLPDRGDRRQGRPLAVPLADQGPPGRGPPGRGGPGVSGSARRAETRHVRG